MGRIDHVASARLLNERFILMLSLAVIIALYGGIGRDLFFNRLSGARGEDAIGAILVYLRAGSAALGIVLCVYFAGSLKPIESISILFVPYLLLAVYSLSWSDDAKNTLRTALLGLLFYAAISAIANRITLEKMAAAMLRLLALTLIASVVVAVLIPSIGTHTNADIAQSVHAGRWRGIFVHKNGLGANAAYGAILFWYYGDLLSRSRLLVWVARISALLCLVFSGSATSIVVAAALAAYATMLAFKKVHPLVWLICICGFAVLYYLFAQAGWSNLIFDLIGRDETLTGRTLIWDLAYVSMGQSPFLGYGFGSFGGVEFGAKVAATYTDNVLGPESSYYNIILELGVIGLALFIIPLLECFRRAFTYGKDYRFGDRRAIECFALIVFGAMVAGISETPPWLFTSYGGPINFAALFSLASVRTQVSYASTSYRLRPGRVLTAQMAARWSRSLKSPADDGV
ncbi:O-antigen ligase family protein [Xanthobacter autotrophicus]|uniref:O-antigen ligase family protein n=1 Tax=Xanthobacter autotrophicus TaxID=280 RepID=UPI003726F0FE